jgi:mRNA-degrading endonuclease toxin of MazEF toxin-antitoxin module
VIATAASDDVEPGDVYWVDIPKAHTVGAEQYENRPYVIVSRVEINRRGTVVGVPFTSVKDVTKLSYSPPHWIFIPDTELTVGWGAHLAATGSQAKTDQVRVLARDRLGTKIGRVSKTALVSIKLGLSNVLDLE